MSKIPYELAVFLKNLGVKYVFGIPGGPTIPYIEELKNQGIEFITTANEQSAAIMADVTGRLTGIPGICHGTYGAGATNLLTGVGEALLDRSPLIAFTTEVKDEDRGRVIQMNIDHQKLYFPVTKKTDRLSQSNFYNLLKEAVDISLEEQPGPVHIGLPSDLVEKEIKSNLSKHEVKIKKNDNNIDFSDKDKIISLIKKAKRPVVAVGLTAHRFKLKDKLNKLVDKLKVPVFLTPMAKGLISEKSPWYGGVLFHAKSEIAADIYRKADLIIGIGYDPIEFNYEAWMPKVPLIHVDTSKADIASDYKEIYEIIGDLNDSVEMLLKETYPNYKWKKSEILENKEKLFGSLMIKTDKLNPVDLITELQEQIPDDSIVTSDVGAHLHLMGQLWKADNNKFIITNGWSGMGFSIPAAIGAKLSKPESAVVSISGDGGFLMNCGEIALAKRLNLKIVFIVMVDKDYSLIKVKQNWKEVEEYATQVTEDDYFKSDYFLGVPILKLKDKEDLEDVLKAGFNHKGPVIIEAEVDGSIYQELITRDYK
jgi:acetolactate synthase-1/2/3 large subunit